MNEFCGCGKPVRYMISDDKRGACNKYTRCLSYEKLVNLNFCLYQYKLALERIADSGVGYYETLAYEAISNIRLLENINGC